MVHWKQKSVKSYEKIVGEEKKSWRTHSKASETICGETDIFRRYTKPFFLNPSKSLSATIICSGTEASGWQKGEKSIIGIGNADVLLWDIFVGSFLVGN